MKTYPIGLTIIGITAIVLMYLAPKQILIIMIGLAVFTFGFTCYAVIKSEDLTKDITNDETYDSSNVKGGKK